MAPSLLRGDHTQGEGRAYRRFASDKFHQGQMILGFLVLGLVIIP